jgi:hypothetical protein
MDYIKRIFQMLVPAALALSCSFDYNTMQSEDETLPDITMETLEWVRVRDGNPVARLQAEVGDRYEKIHIMELKNYSFEQYDVISGTVDSAGAGGSVKIELESGNLKMSDSVSINVESEEIQLDAEDLEWRDKEHTLSSGQYSQVHITGDKGTDFSGAGFSADVRSRTWLFSAGATGDYYFDEEEGEEREVIVVETGAAGPTAAGPPAGSPAASGPAASGPAASGPAASSPAADSQSTSSPSAGGLWPQSAR